MTVYHFQHRALRQEFLDVKADDLNHARQIMTTQGDNPLHWRLSSLLNDLPPRR